MVKCAESGLRLTNVPEARPVVCQNTYVRGWVEEGADHWWLFSWFELLIILDRFEYTCQDDQGYIICYILFL